MLLETALSYCFCWNRLPFYVLHGQRPTREVESSFQTLFTFAHKTIALAYVSKPQPPLFPFVAQTNLTRSFYNWFRMVIGCFTVVLIVWFLFSFVHTFLILLLFGYMIFNFVSRGCGFAYDQSKFTFDYNTSRDYKCLGETPPLPRIQGRIRIVISQARGMYGIYCIEA